MKKNLCGLALVSLLIQAQQVNAASAEAGSPSFLEFLPLILLVSAIWWIVKRQKKQSADSNAQAESAKPSKKISLGVKVLLVLGCVVFLGKLIESGEASSSNRVPAATPTTAKPEAIRQQWEYSHEEDAMSKGYRHYASAHSTNTVSFAFPYQGEQHGTLTLRTDPKDQKYVIFSIEKGQLLCPSYEVCTVHIRFDDEDAIGFGGRGPADNSTETVFIHDYEKFVGKMVKAKRVRISTNIYREGSPVFEFNVGDFDASKYVPAK